MVLRGGRGFGGFENQFPPNGLVLMEAIEGREEGREVGV